MAALMTMLRCRTEALYREARVPLAIYFPLSAVTAVLLAIGGWRQAPLPGDDPPYVGLFIVEVADRYFDVVSNWDGGWYRNIAESGYPRELPRSEDGTVLQNVWAFWPLYPALVRLIMNLSGQSFEVSAWLLSIVCAGLAVVLLYRFLCPRLGRFGSGAAVACLLAFPTAPILQVGYPEGLALLLILLALLALGQRRYGAACLTALALSLTRPVALPLAIVIILHGFARWRKARQGHEDFPTRERIQVALTAMLSVALFTLWPLAADYAVGERNAYIKTFTAWSANQTGVGVLGGWANELMRLTPLGIMCLGLMLWTCYLVLRSGSERWPAEMRMWAVAYTGYVFTTTRPTPSIFRYLMLAVILVLPFPEVVAGRDHQGIVNRRALLFLAVLISLGFVGQYVWIMNVFTIAVAQEQQPFP